MSTLEGDPISLFWVDSEELNEPVKTAQEQFARFPGSRYMGSKNRIIDSLWKYLAPLPFTSVLDAFAGSNVVSYFLKCQGKQVTTNDFLAFSYVTSKAIIENSSETLDNDDIEFLLSDNDNDRFVQNTFNGIFFNEEDNSFIDRVRKNISFLDSEYTRAISYSALVRACVKKRSRGIFTFVGERYEDGRKDMRGSLKEHFLESIALFNDAVFDNGRPNLALNERVEELSSKPKFDLVYLDPPYFSPKSDNDYVRRYHFLEGLVRNWEDVEMQPHTAVRKFKSFPTPFSKKDSAYAAFDLLFNKFASSVLVVSYSSNSIPSKDELFQMLRNYKIDVACYEVDLTYSFGNQGTKVGNSNNRVKEYIFIGT